VKFLIDMPLSRQLATWLGGQGHDAVHALALGLARASDLAFVGFEHAALHSESWFRRRHS